MAFRTLLVVLALIAAACGSAGSDSAADSDSGDDAAVEEVDESEGEEPEDDQDAASNEVAEEETAEETTEEAETEPAEAEPEPADAQPELPEADSQASGDERAPVGPPASLVADCSAVPEASVGLQSGTINSGGLEYAFQFVVPSSYDGETPIPVILDFHGLGSNGAQQAVFSGIGPLAETEGFLAVEPTGIPAAGGLDDRNAWELPQFDEPGRDDVQMVLDLIDFVSQNVCVDPGRIFSIGMSNGGLFTAELVCDLSERIAAAVSVAGVTHDDSCNPTRAVPYLAFHGIDDGVVPFNGGGQSSLGASPFFEQVIPEEFSQFADDFGCTGFEDSAVTPQITLTSYAGCNDDVELGFYAIAGAGHTWPGSPISAAITSLGVTNTDISATAIAWEFFQENPLPGATEIAEG